MPRRERKATGNVLAADDRGGAETLGMGFDALRLFHSSAGVLVSLGKGRLRCGAVCGLGLMA